MAEIHFHEGDTSPTQPPQIQKGGRVTKWLMNHSFGLITTERQATIVQVAIIVIGLVYIFLVWPDGSGSTVQLPSDELINSPQYPPNYEQP